MALVLTPNLKEKLGDAYVIIDTCTIIDASKSEEALSFLNILQEWGCILLSTLSVKNEFTRSARSKEEYRKLSEFIESFGILFINQLEEKMLSPDGIRFNIGLNRCRNIHPGYVDSMLLAIPYFYPHSPEKIYIVTSNFHDVPAEFFDVAGFATYHATDFHNIGIYEFNLDNFNELTRKL